MDTQSGSGRIVGLMLYVAAMWLILRPGHLPIGPALALALARICYQVSAEIGALGLAAEAAYWRQVA